MAVNDAVEDGESFDWTDTTSQRYARGGSDPNDLFITTTNPRSGSRCLVCTVGAGTRTAWIQHENLPSRTARFFHLGFRPESNNDITILGAYEGTTLHCDLRIVDRTLYATRNGTAIGSPASIILNANQWYSVKVWFNIHDTTGRVRVKVNASTVIDFTGDTRNGGSGIQNMWRLGNYVGTTSGTHYRVDDLAWMNGDHVDAIDFEDVRVSYAPPNGAGDSAQFTPSNVTGPNWQMADDIPPDEDSTFNDAMAVNDIDRYALADIVDAGFIYGVAHLMRAKKTDAGNGEFTPEFKHSTNVTTLTARPLNTTYETFSEFLPNVPGGTGWTEAQVNALLVGVKRTL